MIRLAVSLLPLFLIAAPALADDVSGPTGGGDRYVAAVQTPDIPRGIAAYGPFRVLDAGHAALVDVTDASSPAQFTAMLRDHPGIATLELVECPGTDDDRANLSLGRMIRRADPQAEFAVHSWEDENGREPSDFAPDAPENRIYLDYYRDMGLTAGEATAFYTMTNSVSFDHAKWLTTADLARYVRLDGA